MDELKGRGRLIYAGVFFTTMAVLLLEVVMTKVVSILFGYLFAYHIIGVALLGFGAAGAWLAAFGHGREEPSQALKRIVPFSFLFSLSIVPCFLALNQVGFEPSKALENLGMVLRLLCGYGLLAIPFFLGGMSLGLCVFHFQKVITRVYFFDLLGAGCGCLLAIGGLNYIGGPSCIALSSLLAALACLFFAHASSGGHRGLISAYCLGSLGLVAFFILFNPIEVNMASEKTMPKWSRFFGLSGDGLDEVRWNSIARVEVSKPYVSRPWMAGELSSEALREKYEQRFFTQDGDAPTILYKPEDGLKEMGFLANCSLALPYQIQYKPEVLVMGSGAGLDVLIALRHDASEVTAVELNPAIVYLVKNTYKDYAGQFFYDKRVKTVVAEGRHFLARSKDLYDVIQLTGVDTFAAQASGAYALAENYLYTLEALWTYWDHLTENGILAFSREFKAKDYSLRLCALEKKALGEKGIDFSRHIYLASGDSWASILLKKSPFTKQEIDLLNHFSKRIGVTPYFDPYTRRDNPFDQLIRAEKDEEARLSSLSPYDIRPPTDDQPFFFFSDKWEKTFKALFMGEKSLLNTLPRPHALILLSLSEMSLLILLFILFPLIKLRKVWGKVAGKGFIIIYFACLGLSYIFVEIVLMQKFILFLGYPTYSISIVLASMLASSGLGSFFARRWEGESLRALRRIIPLLVLLLILYSTSFLSRLLGLFLDQALTLRVLITVGFVFLLAFFMGMPFPLGISFLRTKEERLVPWTWAINGFTSVLASVLSAMMSTLLGYQKVLLVAALLYFLAFLMVKAMR